jgi:hypothetical protein
MVYLWRAVDAEGEVLDVLIQVRRDKHAALKLMRNILINTTSYAICGTLTTDGQAMSAVVYDADGRTAEGSPAHPSSRALIYNVNHY